MKHWYYFLAFLFLSSSVCYPQNVYPHFSELKGMEDYNGNTNLFYRINSSQVDSFNENQSNNIYLFNVLNKIDSLFQLDYSYYNNYTGGGYRVVNGYDFWEKNPRKFIICGAAGGIDGSPFIERFDGFHITISFFGEPGFISISHQNDSLLYSTFKDGFLYRSTSGGISWDTAGKFNAISLSPYNDKVLFASESGGLYKTTDGGLTKHLVDTISADSYSPDQLFYDKDTNYIYRVTIHNGLNKVLVSNNSGELNSWQEKFTSPLPIYLSVDYSVPGSVYLATNKYIYHSTDNGNTFTLSNSFDKKLVGIYKKPGSSKLYAATDYIIYEIDGSTINIIKQLPVDKEIFKFDPLDIGNKWVYNEVFIPPGSQPKYDLIYSREIIKDTLFTNQRLYKQVKTIEWESGISFSYERIDSTTGQVYMWYDYTNQEYLVDDLSAVLGDTINGARFGPHNFLTMFDSLTTKNMFGLLKENHTYSENSFYSGYNIYSLTKDFGLTYRDYYPEDYIITYDLKGCIIKGVVYGDTSLIVGIKDKPPLQPVKFALLQNYPNPFNPSTTIKYSIASRSIVTIKIYDILGKEIAVLVNAEKEPGNYDINFNASRL
jgi:hypothetical protein